MSQVTDRTVGANPTGFDMRTELNNIIGALETCNSGTSEPLNTVQFMYWFDTSNATYYYLKQRNHDNTAWNTILRYTVSSKIVELVSNGVVINDSNLVHKTGDETIAGIKTFSSFPVTPSSAPTTNYQVANKKYVDDNATTPDATETTKGKVELATNAEVQAGTDTTRAVTPAGMKAGLNASGTAPIYACRAWVNFNGMGTVAIRASGNVSSITDNAVGDYTVNFTSAMVDANYCYVTGIRNSGGTSSMTIQGHQTVAQTNSSIRLEAVAASTRYDIIDLCVSIFR